MIEKTEDFWKESWQQHWSSYLATPPHLGPCLELLFPNKSWTFLEMGGGSMRDSAYLAGTGRKVTGSDYLPEAAAKAQETHKGVMDVITLNAFETGLPDNAFDVTFHNGLWVLFSKDEDIRKMAAEQARISRRYMAAIVHCAHNQKYREDFKERAKTDDLYNLRFFEIDEIRAFCEPYGETLVVPCGSPLTYQLLGGWRWGRFPQSVRRLIYKYAAPRTDPSEWHRIMVVTRVK
jgi:hypothetical protein